MLIRILPPLDPGPQHGRRPRLGLRTVPWRHWFRGYGESTEVWDQHSGWRWMKVDSLLVRMSIFGILWKIRTCFFQEVLETGGLFFQWKDDVWPDFGVRLAAMISPMIYEAAVLWTGSYLFFFLFMAALCLSNLYMAARQCGWQCVGMVATSVSTCCSFEPDGKMGKSVIRGAASLSC